MWAVVQKKCSNASTNKSKNQVSARVVHSITETCGCLSSDWKYRDAVATEWFMWVCFKGRTAAVEPSVVSSYNKKSTIRFYNPFSMSSSTLLIITNSANLKMEGSKLTLSLLCCFPASPSGMKKIPESCLSIFSTILASTTNTSMR